LTPADQAVRDRLRTDLDTTFFVEAGAGTGKTNELVKRIVALVASGRIVMEELAAITFTDAAAAELRDRVRQELEAAGTPETSRAAREIDLAAIQTIHAFAASLLRTFPLEAGLAPGFTVWSDLEQSIAFKERFRRWLYEDVPARPEAAAALSLALQLGLTPVQLEAVAGRLQEHYDVLRPDSRWSAGHLPDAIETAGEIGRDLSALRPLVGLAKDPDRDVLAQAVQLAQPVARRLSEAATREEALVALKRFRELGLSDHHGRQADWQPGPAGNPVPRIKAAIGSANRQADDTLAAHRSAVLGEVLGHLRDLVVAFAAERRAASAAMFHDLLTWARDLLRDQPEVRRRAHARFKAILVDEFQDTDPLQLEIAWFLAADPAQAEDRDWRRLRLTPGRLFVVGDPKQSIYRFRRADIGIYQEVLASLGQGADVVQLSQNFRSTRPLLHWVNHHLSAEMQPAPGMQPAYAELYPRPESHSANHRRGAYRLGGQVDGKAGERWLAEATAAARLARQVVDEGWLVTRRGEDTPRPASYRDVCVLLPTRSNLRRLERAFQREDVPYRMESGSLVLNTPEVRDLLSCLRAIEDPSDQVALVAALRSPAYACSDADLLAWVEAGGRLDSMAAFPEDAPAAVGTALESLRAFHLERHRRSSAATIEAFVAERLLAVQAFAQERPREAWRRLRYVAAQTRRLAGAGQPSLRAAVDWLEGLQRETFYDPESAIPEGDEDAVRFMTVHGSKGLEFPIVILTGLGVPRRRPAGPRILCDHQAGRLELQLNRNFATAGFDATRDELLDGAEQVRLLYVATTRARDHLVLSLFHTRNEQHSPAGRILERLKAAPDLCHVLAAPSGGPPTPPAVVEPVSPPSAEEYAHAEESWIAARDGLIERLARERRFTATSLAGSTPSPAEAGEGWGEGAPVEDDEEPEVSDTEVPLFPAGKGSTALGLAVHATLQAVDLRSLEGLAGLAEAVARGYGAAGRAADVEALVRNVARSAAIQRALASPRLWREAPIGITCDGALLEGSIDLLVEHAGGTLGVIDYKTDHITPAQLGRRMAHYRLQGGAYAFALRRATGRRVASVEFVFAALGQTVSLSEAEIEQAMAEVAARLTPP
jgi:ATP-dependent helicase/nuclease subunit A